MRLPPIINLNPYPAHVVSQASANVLAVIARHTKDGDTGPHLVLFPQRVSACLHAKRKEL